LANTTQRVPANAHSASAIIERGEDNIWADAARRVDAGLSWVRIGSLHGWRGTQTGETDFGWLDRAMCHGDAGLKIILGTPTATPPRWMLDKHPDMLAIDRQGRPRGFGSAALLFFPSGVSRQTHHAAVGTTLRIK
jgi:beta-galactosidase